MHVGHEAVRGLAAYRVFFALDRAHQALLHEGSDDRIGVTRETAGGRASSP